jgi:ABC-2 type transport system ATP-binding protein
MAAIIELKGIEKRFALRNWRTTLLRKAPVWVDALRGVSFSVHRGEILGLLGPNGAGKTTLIKILATLVVPDSGTAAVAGNDLKDFPHLVREKIGLVNTNERSFYWRLTGRQNLEFFARLYNLHGPALKKRVTRMLEITEMTEKADAPFMTYSTGQRQRLAIARSLLSEPEVLLFDEPTSSLDPIGTAGLIAFIKNDLVGQRQKTIVWCTHDLEEATKVSDRIVILHQGRVVSRGTLGQMQEQVAGDTVCEMEIGSHPDDIMDRLSFPGIIAKNGSNGCDRFKLRASAVTTDIPLMVRELNGHGIDIYSCRVKPPSLEEMFSRAIEEQKEYQEP